MQLSGQLHAVISLTWAKNSGTIWRGGCVGPSFGMDHSEKSLMLAPGLKPTIVQLVD